MNSISTKGDSFAPPPARRGARIGTWLFTGALDRLDAALEFGAIEGHLPDGSVRILGGKRPGPIVRVELHRWRTLIRLARKGSVGWYEAWEKGEWSSPDPTSFFELAMLNRKTLGLQTRSTGIWKILARFANHRKRNDRDGAKSNILAHYDLGNEFYAAWLDETMTYSSAMFDAGAPDEPLPLAQNRKCRALIDRLELTAPADILEIGSGWGYLAGLAADDGHGVSSITLSPSQLAFSKDRHPNVRFSLCDYRDATGQFDAILSAEMVEAVGQNYWSDYLKCVARLLKPGGRAALQFIAIDDDVFEAYAANRDFIQTYVFPGGMLLSESRFRALAEAHGLAWHDVHHFGQDYAETLRRWRTAFDEAASADRLPAHFDERFIRLWRYYLMYCEGGFRSGGISVAQVTLVKNRGRNT